MNIVHFYKLNPLISFILYTVLQVLMYWWYSF